MITIMNYIKVNYDLFYLTRGWASAQLVYMVGYNRRLVHPLALVGRYSKLGSGSMVRFRASPLCSTKCVLPETDQISR